MLNLFDSIDLELHLILSLTEDNPILKDIVKFLELF